MAREWLSALVDAWIDDVGDKASGSVITKDEIQGMLDDVFSNGMYLDPSSDANPYWRVIGGLMLFGAGGGTALDVAMKRVAANALGVFEEDGATPAVIRVAGPTDGDDAANKDYVDAAIAGGVPAGSIMGTWRAAAPSGWLLLDGSTINIVTYPDLCESAPEGIVVETGGTAFTADAGTDVVTSAGHGLNDADAVMVTTSDALPAGLAEKTVYYVRDKTTDTFKLALTVGGAAVDITDTGTGTHNWHTQVTLPNAKQRLLLGKADSGTGATLLGTGGAIDHVHPLSEFPEHSHGVTDGGHGHGVTDPGHAHALKVNGTYPSGSGGEDRFFDAGTPSADDLVDDAVTGLTVNAGTTGITIDNAGDADPNTEAANPPFLAVNWMIKT